MQIVGLSFSYGIISQNRVVSSSLLDKLCFSIYLSFFFFLLFHKRIMQATQSCNWPHNLVSHSLQAEDMYSYFILPNICICTRSSWIAWICQGYCTFKPQSPGLLPPPMPCTKLMTTCLLILDFRVFINSMARAILIGTNFDKNSLITKLSVILQIDFYFLCGALVSINCKELSEALLCSHLQ